MVLELYSLYLARNLKRAESIVFFGYCFVDGGHVSGDGRGGSYGGGVGFGFFRFGGGFRLLLG